MRSRAALLGEPPHGNAHLAGFVGEIVLDAMAGAVERVRPKMMAVAAIMTGLLPILWSSGAGSEIMQRIAVPMIGGMVSSTILTLIVIPAIYAVVKARLADDSPCDSLEQSPKAVRD